MKEGLSIEEYSKLTGLSLVLSRYRLQKYYEGGKLCLDSSFGGLRYHLNDIILIEFK